MKTSTLNFGAIALVLLLSACAAPLDRDSNVTDFTPSNGRLVMTVTDAAANMGNVSSITLTVDTVALHSDADGWITVATPRRTYDLLALKASGVNALLTDIELAPARYDQVRLDVSNVLVVDSNGTHQAKVPSQTLRLNGEIVVLSDKIATASFDFIADESLHVTGDGKYIFAPVIQFESRTDANVDTDVNGNVRHSGGGVQSSSRVSMDALGNLVLGGKLPPYLQINADGSISGTENKLVPKNP